MTGRWRTYSRVVRRLVRDRRTDDRIASVLTLSGARRPPDGERVHDDIVIMIKTERGLEGAVLHPSGLGSGPSLLGRRLKSVWRSSAPSHLSALALDAMASARSGEVSPLFSERLPRSYRKAEKLRARVIADTVEDRFGESALLIGYSSAIHRELKRRGLLRGVVDADPRVSVPRRAELGEFPIVATGMVLANGSFKRIVARHRGPIMLYSQTCPNLTPLLARAGVVDVAIVESFPFHFCPGETRLRVFTADQGG